MLNLRYWYRRSPLSVLCLHFVCLCEPFWRLFLQTKPEQYHWRILGSSVASSSQSQPPPVSPCLLTLSSSGCIAYHPCHHKVTYGSVSLFVCFPTQRRHEMTRQQIQQKIPHRWQPSWLFMKMPQQPSWCQTLLILDEQCDRPNLGQRSVWMGGRPNVSAKSNKRWTRRFVCLVIPSQHRASS